MAAAPQATAEAKVLVTPKPGTKFYHGHGHHHFEAGQPIALRASVAETLLTDGLVVPWSSTPAAAPTPAAEPAKAPAPAALDPEPGEAALESAAPEPATPEPAASEPGSPEPAAAEPAPATPPAG